MSYKFLPKFKLLMITTKKLKKKDIPNQVNLIIVVYTNKKKNWILILIF